VSIAKFQASYLHTFVCLQDDFLTSVMSPANLGPIMFNSFYQCIPGRRGPRESAQQQGAGESSVLRPLQVRGLFVVNFILGGYSFAV